MNNRGFTIIELLVVVSIIGMISSVALANLQTAKENAKLAASKQFHASIQRALGIETVASWEFDEGSGTVLVDSAGSSGFSGAMNGTIINGSWVPNAGVSGSALLFNANSYVYGTNFPNPGENGDITISAWVKPTNIVGVNSIFYAGDNGNGGGNCTSFEMLENGGKFYTRNQTSEKLIASNVNLINNVWQHLVYVYNGDKVSVYLDNKLVGQVSGGVGTSDCPTGGWSIGTPVTTASVSPNNSRYFKGTIDSIRIYNNAL